jgi:hypothetical protein
MKRNISLDIQQQVDEIQENEDEFLKEFSMDEIETIPDENSAQNIKTLMMQTKSQKQPTIDQYFQPFRKEYSSNDILEHENNLLKIEMKEIKDKLFLFEQHLLCPSSSSTPISSNISYDKLSTKIREMENEMKKMKTVIEYLEGHNHELEERIDYLESLFSTEEDEEEDES